MVSTVRFAATQRTVFLGPSIARSKRATVAPWSSRLRRSFATGDDDDGVTDHFRVFGMERTFSVDRGRLRDAYRALMREHHPDKRRGRSDVDGNDDSAATDATRAYEVLSDDHARASHLLELRGRPLDESDTGALVGTDFLLRIMETREAVDRCSDEEDEDGLRRLADYNADAADAARSAMAGAFDEGDWDAFREQTARLRYLNRVEETISERTNVVQ